MGPLTKAGERYLEGYCDLLAAASTEKWNTIGERSHLQLSGYGTKVAIGRLPHKLPSYGELLTEDNKNFVAKCRHPTPKFRPTHTTYGNYKGNKFPIYTNENFGETRVWLEAKSRDQESLFAPVVAYDNTDFRWLVMEETTHIGRTRRDERKVLHDYRPRVEDKGWYPHDVEIGRMENTIVAHDYGQFQRKGQWNVSEKAVFEGLS